MRNNGCLDEEFWKVFKFLRQIGQFREFVHYILKKRKLSPWICCTFLKNTISASYLGKTVNFLHEYAAWFLKKFKNHPNIHKYPLKSIKSIPNRAHHHHLIQFKSINFPILNSIFPLPFTIQIFNLILQFFSINSFSLQTNQNCHFLPPYFHKIQSNWAKERKITKFT